MAQRFYEPIARIFTNAGAVGVGYKYYFYETGTTTPVTTYQDDGLSVANTNPVISDSNGRFPEIWYSDLSQLKLIVKDSSDNTVETVDPVGATASAVSLNDFDVRPTSYWGVTAGTSTAYTLVANPTISAYANTQTFVVQVHLDCGDSPTLAIDGLSVLNWKKYTQQGTKVALKANDLRASQRYFCINDGVDVVCLNPSSLPILSGSATALTIATGVVTITNNSSTYVLDTEGSASTDDLDTISGGQNGQVIFVRSTSNDRDITLKTETGNIVNPSGLNITLGNINDVVLLRYNGTNWIVISFNLSDSEPIRLISTSIASSSSAISFTGLSSSYSKYIVEFIDVVPATNDVLLLARFSTDGGSTYPTSTYASSVQTSANTSWVFSNTPANSIGITSSNGGGYGLSTTVARALEGSFELYNPSSSTVNKKCLFKGTYINAAGDRSQFIGQGIYTSNTSSVNAIQFLMSSGNIASGTFKLYGVK